MYPRPHPRPPLTLSHLRDIGFSIWDPIGLLPRGELWDGHPAAGEYDSYLACAAGMLRDGRSDSECAAYLARIETDHIGLGRARLDDAVRRALDTVTAIRRYVDKLDADWHRAT